MSAPVKHSPFKFLDSYTLKDADLFFGRDQEVEEAYTKVFQSKILLVYGASGTGKSSLINCGLANKFSASDWLPISVRRGGNILRSLMYQLERLSYADVGFEKPNLPTKEEILASIQSVFLDYFKPIYLIFDQFEELFIFGDKEEWQTFTDTLSFLLESELDLHFIFVMRGDYLEYLSEFEQSIPGFFDNRLRVEPMRGSQAKQSISGPCEQAGIQVEDGFEEALLERINSKSQRIEPTFLQVFLDKIYKQAQSRAKEGSQLELKRSAVEDLGGISDVLAEFVDEQIFQMPDPKKAWSVLKCFVSLDGTKIPLRASEVKSSLEQLQIEISDVDLENTIADLVNKRILKGKDEEERFELRHDSLALKIYERISIQERERRELQRFLNISLIEYKKRGTLLKEEDLDYLNGHQRKLELDSEMEEFIQKSRRQSSRTRRKRQNQRVIGALILLLALSSLYGWYYSQGEKARADQAAQVAQEESLKAQEQKGIADQERFKAEANAQIALDEKQKAEAAKENALAESQRARIAENSAREEKQKAEAEREKAIASEVEAQEQKNSADLERAKAERLSKIAQSRQLALQSQQVSFPLNANLALNAFLNNQSLGDYPEQADLYQALLMAYRSGASLKLLQHSAAFKNLWLNEGRLILLDQEGQLFSQTQGSRVIQKIPLKVRAEMAWPLAQNRIAIQGEDVLSIYDLKASRIIDEKPIDFTADDVLEVNNVLYLLAGTELYSYNENARQVELIGNSRAISASDNRLLSLDPNGQVLLRNANSWQSIAQTSFKADIMRLSPDGSNLALANQKGEIRLLNLNSKAEIQLSAHLSAVSDLQFSADGKSLASASMDRSIKVWSLENTLERPKEIRGLNYWMQKLCFANGELYASSYEGDLYLIPLKNKDLAQKLCQLNPSPMNDSELKTYRSDLNLNKEPCYEN